jgi:hypothetical protein
MLLQRIAIVVVALEILVRDVDGWRTHFPDAKLEAERLLDASPGRMRAWLLDRYM